MTAEFFHMRPHRYDRQLDAKIPYPNGGLSFLVTSGSTQDTYYVYLGIFDVNEFFSYSIAEHLLEEIYLVHKSAPILELISDHQPTLSEVLVEIFKLDSPLTTEIQAFISAILAQNGHAETMAISYKNSTYTWKMP